MINMNYRSRELVGANVCTLFNIYLAMGTLIRIRNVCFSYYRKSEVDSYFQDIEWKKVELYGFFENYP